MAAAQSLNYCLYCKKSHQLQLKKHNFHIDVLSCRQFYPTEIAFINEQNIIQNHHMTQQQYYFHCDVHSGWINYSPQYMKS